MHIRSAALRGFRATVAELGGDADRLARTASLDPAALDSDDVLVTEEAAGLVLELAAAELDRPDLALRIAARQDITMLGSLAVAIQHSATMDDALECTSRYLFVHSRSLTLRLVPAAPGSREQAALEYGPADARTPQATDLGLGFLHRTIGYLAGGPYGLGAVELPHPPAAGTAAYEAFFGAPLRVLPGGTTARLRVPQRLGSQALTGVNRTLRQLALAFLEEQAPTLPPGAPRSPALAARVRAVVREWLGTRPVDTGSVASSLATHPRTLQRRLEAEGTSFGEVVDDVRRSTAHRLLTTTDLPLGQVARMVGFAEQSTLSRASRRWWDAPPRAVRAAVTS